MPTPREYVMSMAEELLKTSSNMPTQQETDAAWKAFIPMVPDGDLRSMLHGMQEFAVAKLLTDLGRRIEKAKAADGAHRTRAAGWAQTQKEHEVMLDDPVFAELAVCAFCLLAHPLSCAPPCAGLGRLAASPAPARPRPLR